MLCSAFVLSVLFSGSPPELPPLQRPTPPSRPEPTPEPEPTPTPSDVTGPPSLPPVPGEPGAPSPSDPGADPTADPSTVEPPQPETDPTVSPFGPSPEPIPGTGVAPLMGADHDVDWRPPPPPPPDIPPAPRDGSGLLTSAGILGGSGLLVRLWTTIAAIRTENGPTSNRHVDIAALGSFFYTPLIAGGLVTAGFGMGRRGRWDGYRERYKNRESPWVGRPWLGWGLFAGGMLVWTGTRAAALGCGSEDCTFRMMEVGYYLSLAGTIPGVMMGSYGSGLASYRRDHPRSRSLGAAPTITAEFKGLSIGGRF